MTQESEHVLLFHYYAEQTRHTENLRIELTKFFAGLLSAIVVAGGFLVQNADPGQQQTAVRVIAVLGFSISLAAIATLWVYQSLIESWTEAKNAVEQILLDSSELDVAAIRETRQSASPRAPRPLPLVLLPFVVGVAAFLFAFVQAQVFVAAA